jgi:hypothetical protein
MYNLKLVKIEYPFFKKSIFELREMVNKFFDSIFMEQQAPIFFKSLMNVYLQKKV